MMRNGTNTSFGSLKQIDAGVLNVGYAEAGHTDGPVVILLHGWPYDILSYVDVAPLLAKSGYRVIVPYLRGFGTTRFLSSETLRNGQQSVVALDIIALMDALRIEKAIVGGYDWGARTANIIAALRPEGRDDIGRPSSPVKTGDGRLLDFESIHQRDDIESEDRWLPVADCFT